MSKILVKTRYGLYVREKSEESGKEPEKVHPNKLKTWLAMAQAAHNSAGGSMEDILKRVTDEMKGIAFKDDKPKVEVNEDEYQDLIIQAVKKKISPAELNRTVTLIPIKKKTIEEILQEFTSSRN